MWVGEIGVIFMVVGGVVVRNETAEIRRGQIKSQRPYKHVKELVYLKCAGKP